MKTPLTSIDFHFPSRHYYLHLRFPDVFSVVGGCMFRLLQQLWRDEQAQDIAEYAVMLAVILVLVIGTVRLIGGNANNAFSTVASTIN